MKIKPRKNKLVVSKVEFEEVKGEGEIILPSTSQAPLFIVEAKGPGKRNKDIEIGDQIMISSFNPRNEIKNKFVIKGKDVLAVVE